MIEEVLKSIGLTQNEIKIYLALLELGSSQMGAICGRIKIHRRNVYDSIEMLKDKGFVSATVVNNRNVFEPVTPQRIIDILEERKIDVQSILPELLAKQGENKSVVKVYTGQAGRKVVFEDKLNYVEEQYVLGAHEPSSRSSAYIENYHMRRIKKKIHLKMLFNNSAKENAMKFSEYKYVTAKVLPDKFVSPIAINIYGNRTAILLGSGTMEPLSILIEDEGLALDFRNYFDMLWKISRSL